MSALSTDIVTNLQELLKMEYLIFQRKVVPNKQVHSILAGKNISKLRGRGLDFEEVRKYVSGDDIRNIDWKVTARTRVTHTKVFTEEKERPVFTIVDQSSKMFFGSVRYTKSVVAAHAAAISAFRTLKVGDRFGGIVYSDKDESFIQPKRSRAAALRYLECVVDFNERLKERSTVSVSAQRFNEILRRTQASITHDYVVTIISDFVEMDDESRKHLINLAHHNDIILVQINDPFEMEVPDHKVLLGDGNYQIQWKDSEKHKGQMAKHLADLKSRLLELRKYGIVKLDLDTTTEVSEQLKEVFSR